MIERETTENGAKESKQKATRSRGLRTRRRVRLTDPGQARRR